MERLSEVVGLPVISAENGKKVGTVANLIFCPQRRRLEAVLLVPEGYLSGEMVILLKDVLNIGRDAVITSSSSCISAMKAVQTEGELEETGKLEGLKIYSRAGEDLGVVKDVLFDQKTGLVEGVEVSDGIIQDIIQGRRVIPLFGKVEFGGDILLVDREAVEESEETGGGIKRILLGERGD